MGAGGGSISHSRTLHRLGLLAIGLVACGLIASAAWLRPAFTPAIAGPNAIASLEPVTLGGARQWILIRGADRSKPVILFLHGQPGAPLMGLAHQFQSGLEQEFVVVQWDRRGAGKSFGEPLGHAPMSTTQELSDAAELIGLLHRRLGAERVIVVGQDDGATLGAALAQAHPELVRALVAVGMTACTPTDIAAIQDSWLRSRAALVGDARIAALAGAGGEWNRGAALQRYGGVLVRHTSPWSLRIALATAPEYRLADALAVDDGARFVRTHLQQDGPAQPLARSIPALRVPVYVLLGRKDYVSPAICSERYSDALQAPINREIWFERSAHYPFMEEADHFRQVLQGVVAETPSA